MEQVDEAAHTATMQAQGSDRRGQGGAKATIVSRLAPAGEGSTRVDVDTDYHITGRLARFGRGGMIEDISERLLKEFAKRLADSLEGPNGQDEPAAGDEASAADGASAADHAPPAPTEAVPEPPPGDAAAPPAPPLADNGAAGLLGRPRGAPARPRAT